MKPKTLPQILKRFIEIKILIFIFISSSFIFTACNKEDNNISVVGKWGLKQTARKYYVYNKLTDTKIVDILSTDGEYTIVELNEDNTFYVSNPNDTSESPESGTYSLKDSKITIYNSKHKDDPKTSAYTLTQNELSIIFENTNDSLKTEITEKYTRL